jgi:hypothetical protein
MNGERNFSIHKQEKIIAARAKVVFGNNVHKKILVKVISQRTVERLFKMPTNNSINTTAIVISK